MKTPLLSQPTRKAKVGSTSFSSKHQPGSKVDDLPLPSRHIDRFATLVADDRIKESEKVLVKAAVVALAIWIALTLLFLFACPEDSFERLQGTEQTAYSLVFSVLFVTNVSRLMALVFKDEGRTLSITSGFVLASYSAQLISTVTGGLIAFFPTPVLLDPMSGQRIHMLRWAAWAPLAGLMTFMTEGIDMTLRKDGVQEAWLHAFILFIGTIPGAIFPYVRNSTTWCFLFFFGTLCLGDVYYRYFARRQHYLSIQKGGSAEQILEYHQTRLGYRLLRTCFVMWTFVGVHLIIMTAAPFIFPEKHILREPYIPAISECCVEIISKTWYLMIISSAYELIFDESARTARRLEELRAMMLAVWNKSSDIVIISTRARDDSKRAVSMINPAFLKMQNQDTPGEPNAIVLETPLLDNPLTARKSALQTSRSDKNNNNIEAEVFFIDLNEPIAGPKRPTKKSNNKDDKDDHHDNPTSQQERPSLSPRCLQSLTDILITAWQFPAHEGLVSCDFVYDDGTPSKKPKTAKCEAKVTHLENNTVMIVLSDVTERIRRFEAEKAAVAERTARQRDSEANRFTKHEVKNGLLAAIGLCEAMSSRDGDKKLITELDATLNEVLNTVLAEALARDVIHEVYEPVRERVDLPKLLFHNHTTPLGDRFPLQTQTNPFPEFLFDPNLLKCMHRNAISNACKWGEQDGEVLTELEYKDETKEVILRVVNRPGAGHDELVALSPAKVKEVFAPGKSLHKTSTMEGHQDSRFVSRSTGDGAWIIKKCARLLGGDCTMEFQANRTIFAFTCAAVPFPDPLSLASKVPTDEPAFAVPKGTWGVGIDDSRIQRKLLDRFLNTLGIDPDHRRVLGEDASEILNFNDFVKQLAKEHPDDKILIIADENLDIEGSRTVSGSLSTQQLLEDLGSDEERVLALVRSANDSKEDQELYKSRTHGFFPKVPLKKDKVKETIEPFWTKRFAKEVAEAITAEEAAVLAASSEETEPVNMEAQTYEIMRTIEAIDVLLHGESVPEERWPAIWEKLHLLRGDLQVIYGGGRAKTVTDAITNLRGEEMPADLKNRWVLIRSLVVSLL